MHRHIFLFKYHSFQNFQPLESFLVDHPTDTTMLLLG